MVLPNIPIPDFPDLENGGEQSFWPIVDEYLKAAANAPGGEANMPPGEGTFVLRLILAGTRANMAQHHKTKRALGQQWAAMVAVILAVMTGGMTLLLATALEHEHIWQAIRALQAIIGK